MQKRIYFSLILAVVLVGGAAWMRFTSRGTSPASLSVVDKSINLESYYEDFTPSSAAPTQSNSSAENLTSADLIGRQLIGDYLSLSSQGEVDSLTIESLANKYVDSIPALAVSEQAEFADLNVTANNNANFNAYATNFGKIYLKYVTGITSLNSSGGVAAFLQTGSGDAILKISNIYRNTANELKLLPTPVALTQYHLELVNLYLQNASAMKYVAEKGADPAGAFAGLIMLNENLNREDQIILKIKEVVTGNGI
jgi:hypothetical protein